VLGVASQRLGLGRAVQLTVTAFSVRCESHLFLFSRMRSSRTFLKSFERCDALCKSTSHLELAKYRTDSWKFCKNIFATRYALCVATARDYARRIFIRARAAHITPRELSAMIAMLLRDLAMRIDTPRKENGKA
jgi:hypothetical protein